MARKSVQHARIVYLVPQVVSRDLPLIAVGNVLRTILKP
jgi:hypothetical protein